ncbi:MAG: pyridoxamine 5'-phosphate oxidase [Saprospiraceae bacterium]|nr:pyridoxamine 5'-phosphate oxidase [Saprospiraceae bacterium]
MDISHLRQEYTKFELDISTVNTDPFEQFKKWFDEASASDILEPNAMCLSTAGINLRPSSRIVLLKTISDNGFVFFTNYSSKKGNELEVNPNGSLLFFWKELERQVRIEGKIQKISEQESTDYFDSRPIGNRIGAIVSPQSQRIIDRKNLDDQIQALLEKPQSIHKPSHWGGYVLIPDYFEFWQGRQSRLHDRIVYDKINKSNWEIYRVAP